MKLGHKKVDIRLPGKGNSNSHGARPVHLIITMIKWIRTSRLSIKNSLSPRKGGVSVYVGSAKKDKDRKDLQRWPLVFFAWVREYKSSWMPSFGQPAQLNTQT